MCRKGSPPLQPLSEGGSSAYCLEGLSSLPSSASTRLLTFSSSPSTRLSNRDATISMTPFFSLPACLIDKLPPAPSSPSFSLSTFGTLTIAVVLFYPLRRRMQGKNQLSLQREARSGRSFPNREIRVGAGCRRPFSSPFTPAFHPPPCSARRAPRSACGRPWGSARRLRARCPR